MSTPHLSLYDVLGVSHDASPAEIKAAWREATDRFEPGSSPAQFRMFNEAADVLLDPAKRAAYDASLEPTAEDGPTAEPVAQPVAQPAAQPVAVPTDDEPLTTERRSGVGSALVAALAGTRTVVVVVLAVLVVAAVAGAAVAGIKVHRQAAVADARIEAPPAAERAVKALFSYDYRTLEAERGRASAYMTSSFGAKYLKNFDALEKQKDGTPGLAVQTKAVVTANVQSSGIVDAEADVARVLVFVDLTSRKGGGDPQIFQNRVAVTMVKQGQKWLVDNVNSY